VKTSDVGIHLMHEFEGYRNRPYKCSAKIWTVGWGHAMYGDQLRLPNVRKGTYTGMIRDDYQLKPEDNGSGRKKNWLRYSKMTSFLLNAVFFDLLPIWLAISASLTLVSLWPLM
jgi:GH24 family phage-related lysozyme (muramidase)